MALPDLASAADLSARGVDVSDADLVAAMLAVASSVVRGAAQSPILETTSTVTLWALDEGRWLDLPGKPVTAVSAVVHGGDALTLNDDYRFVAGRLWRCGRMWSAGCEPEQVDVTLTHGFAEVPAYIMQLVCDLAIAGMKVAGEGAHDPRVISERIDDYSVEFASGEEALASAVELPTRTRNALRKKFGGGVAMVGQS